MGSKPFDTNEDEDTKAILTRRALLIRASLAGAGLVVGSGCDQSRSQACLSTPLPDQTDSPEVCLTQDVQDGPEVCLKDGGSQVCLTDIQVTDPDAQDAIDDAPEICLSPDVQLVPDALEAPAPDVEPG